MLICPVCQTPNPADAASCERCNSAFGADTDQTIAVDSEEPRGFSTELVIGEVIADRYEILQRLGRGGMGVVYQALDRELNRVIALKTIRPDLASNAAALRRFKQETLLARQISHRNVVRIFDLGVAGALRFITMEFVEGEDLSSRLQRLGRFAPSDGLEVMKQVCAGLEAAHAEDVVHRDLKPHNVLIDARGHIRIMDFGLARSLEQTGLTRTGMMVGTPDYISPEQVLGERGDSRSDLFAFGVMSYELLTGELPFAAGSLIDAVLKRTQERAKPLELVDPALPKRLCRIVMRCLEPDPARRYQTANDVLNDLNASDEQLPRATVAPRSGALSPGMMLGSRYRIEAEAGEGGMGKVYRAWDVELNRAVAVKVVRPELARNPEALDRLKQEISLASRISHRNVMRIHDLGQADGVLFVSMAWVDGEDLGHLLRRAGPLPEERVLELALEICAGLEAAHEQGIIHRDLKPANILLDSAGHACIADFGLARTLEMPHASSLTRSGEVPGTPRYMSPEQVQGKPVDHRTDIYSLGLILCEMAAGNIPFKDDSVFQTMAQRVSETPRNPKLLNAAISERLASTILRCLERAPERRYSSTAELMHDLQGKAAAPAGWSRKWKYTAAIASFAIITACAGWWVFYERAHATQPPLNGRYVAVLPFRAVGSNADLKYEAEGIGDAISSRLFSLSAVHVTSPLALQDVDLSQPVERVARKVGANIVVQGSVQEQGDRVVVIVNIDNTETHQRLWSKSFGGLRADLLTMEEQLGAQVVTALHVGSSSEDRERASGPPTQNIEAYDLYLKGRDTLKNWRDADGAAAALALFQQACVKDQSFALAWAGVADASLLMYHQKKEALWAEKALAAAREARSSNDALPEVHLALGSVYSATGKNVEAIQEIRRALQLAPNSDNGYIRLGHAYLKSGQSENALKALQKAVELNPYYWNNHLQLGIACFQLGRNDEALKEFKRVVELDSGSASGYNNIGAVYFQQSRWKDCIPAFRKAIELKPSSVDAYSNTGTALFYLGHYSEAITMFEKALPMAPNQEEVIGNIADAYRQAGQWENAQAAFDRAIELTYQQLEVNPQDASALGDLAQYYAMKGGTAKALQLIARARSIDAADNSLMYDEALVNALAGRKQEALKALERALKNGYSVGVARSDPDLKSIRAMPEFEEILKKSGRQK
ncbi:MAG: protein kinase [Bryobacteraceae bacterium]